jgi:hypothetical protein
MKQNTDLRLTKKTLQTGLYLLVLFSLIGGPVEAQSQARTASTGTPETIASVDLQVSMPTKSFSIPAPKRFLTLEPVPPRTPPGWRAFRFTSPRQVMSGTVCDVVDNGEFGPSFSVSDDATRCHATLKVKVEWKNGAVLRESHILIPPNGYVSPELIESH